jgi:3-hydroxyisobutyrate dehydrogenase
MAGDRSVAVLGAGGTMGLPMARNIARAGMQVRAWNRTREKAEPLAGEGAAVLDTASEAAEGADVVLTMLADTDAVLSTMGEALEGASADALWLQMSTIGEAGSERCAELARERGIALVDAPVLGTKQPAEQGKLVVMAAAPEDLRERVQPIFDAVGQRTMWVGDTPGRASLLKVVVNSWILAVVEGTAETVALAEGVGIDPALFFEAVAGGALDLPYLQTKGKAITERNFEPAFTLKLAAKDAGLVEEAARRRDLDLPLPSLIRKRMEQGIPEHGDEDMSATYWASAPAKSPA